MLVSTHYMDEAERCHRLAILDLGRLVANGSPHELMRDLPGSTLRITCGEPRRMQQALAKDPHVIGVAQIGADLRVLTDRCDDDGKTIAERVHATDPNAHIEHVDANLEDVFVASTRKPVAPQEHAA